MLLPIKVSIHNNTANRYFHDFKEAGEIPEGLDLAVSLVVDAASMSSVIKRHAIPFVIALATDAEIEEDDLGSQGVFKVAFTSSLDVQRVQTLYPTDFYQCL